MLYSILVLIWQQGSNPMLYVIPFSFQFILPKATESDRCIKTSKTFMVVKFSISEEIYEMHTTRGHGWYCKHLQQMPPRGDGTAQSFTLNPSELRLIFGNRLRVVWVIVLCNHHCICYRENHFFFGLDVADFNSIDVLGSWHQTKWGYRKLTFWCIT